MYLLTRFLAMSLCVITPVLETNDNNTLLKIFLWQELSLNESEKQKQKQKSKKQKPKLGIQTLQSHQMCESDEQMSFHY